jgi:RNA polymerase sigma-70 factor (ECF subfamily)
MRRTVALIIIGVLGMCFGFIQAENKITVQSMPPVVVKTTPQAGDTAVDPSLKEIRVTFSKDMITEEMWSWVEVSKEAFPQLIGKPRYLSDKRTCVVQVKLEPGKTYAIWLNSKQYNYFKDEDHNPAVPYLLVFQTRE